MSAALATVITEITSAWSTMASWAPVLIAAGFAVVGYAISGLFRIIGVRRRRRRG